MPTTWGANELETVSACGVCDGRLAPLFSDLSAHGEGPWSLARCLSCGTAWLSPRPTTDTIGKAYASDYPPYHQAPARPAPTTLRERLARRVADAHLANHFGYQVPRTRIGKMLEPIAPATRRATERLVRYAPAPTGSRRLLDVGSSHGAYVALMRELGWDAHGIELDADAVARAREAGLPVRQGTMADLRPEIDGEFDFVTIGHVIEHAHDPIASLQAVRRVLSPGGKLWLATPNLRSLGCRVFGSRWRALDPPRHLVLFTPESLNAALQRAGFRDISMVRPVASSPWNVRESARVVGLPWRAARTAAMAGHAVNALTYRRYDLADEMAFVAS
jgi:2-polyprenyl-3-methyl-5-hydroxy-6-metoxy-1,4-benzoquinol methylase